MSVGIAIVQIFFMQIILEETASEQQTFGIMALKNLPYLLIHCVIDAGCYIDVSTTG